MEWWSTTHTLNTAVRREEFHAEPTPHLGKQSLEPTGFLAVCVYVCGVAATQKSMTLL